MRLGTACIEVYDAQSTSTCTATRFPNLVSPGDLIGLVPESGAVGFHTIDPPDIRSLRHI